MRVSPFRHLRISGYLLLPAAFRSLSRLSSALSAKASSLRSLQLNLQNSLAIVKELLVLNIIQDKPVNELFCISKSTIQINRTDYRLQCIRSYRISVTSTCHFFSFPQTKKASQFNFSGAKCQCRLAYHACTQSGQFSLRHLWKLCK